MTSAPAPPAPQAYHLAGNLEGSACPQAANRLGCLGSILVSAIGTLILLVVLHVR